MQYQGITLNELWIIGLSSALIGVLISSSKLFVCCKLCCDTVIEIVLCYSHQACCLLYYSCKITSNNGIHIYLSDVIGFSDLYKNIGGSTNLAEKRREWAALHTPVHPPPKRINCVGNTRIEIITNIRIPSNNA